MFDYLLSRQPSGAGSIVEITWRLGLLKRDRQWGYVFSGHDAEAKLQAMLKRFFTKTLLTLNGSAINIGRELLDDLGILLSLSDNDRMLKPLLEAARALVGRVSLSTIIPAAGDQLQARPMFSNLFFITLTSVVCLSLGIPAAPDFFLQNPMVCHHYIAYGRSVARMILEGDESELAVSEELCGLLAGKIPARLGEERGGKVIIEKAVERREESAAKVRANRFADKELAAGNDNGAVEEDGMLIQVCLPKGVSGQQALAKALLAQAPSQIYSDLSAVVRQRDPRGAVNKKGVLSSYNLLECALAYACITCDSRLSAQQRMAVFSMIRPDDDLVPVRDFLAELTGEELVGELNEKLTFLRPLITAQPGDLQRLIDSREALDREGAPQRPRMR